MIRLSVRMVGSVQGVGFRRYIKRRAEALGVKGWARNGEDGTVAAIFEGDESAIERLIESCRKGNPFARVERIETKTEDYRGEFHAFTILGG